MVGLLVIGRKWNFARIVFAEHKQKNTDNCQVINEGLA